MYLDKTYGSALDYDGTKTPVGIIASVSEDKQNVTIINLKDLKFNHNKTAGNFDPDNPYGGVFKGTWWSTENTYYTDILEIQNFNNDQLLTAAKASCSCACQFYPPE